MLVVVLGMFVCITLAVAVLGLVAVPAARDGEALFLPREEPTEHAGEDAGDASTGTTAATADVTGTVDDLLRADRGVREAAHA